MFYDKYAQICKRRGISMSAAALEAGLSKSLVTKWKVNKVEVPSPDVLKKLSTYLTIIFSRFLWEYEISGGFNRKNGSVKRRSRLLTLSVQ